MTVSFGLVSIPVKLYSATEASRAISFNLLHKGCGSRLKQQYICIKEEVPVVREDMVKGYEFAKDQYVMFTPEELKAMEEAGTHMAEITEFVPIEAVDPVYFDKAYYLAPDKGGAKPFALLASALRESKRCALGRWAARGKQYIVMIRPVEEGLVMQQLLYAGEVRSMKDIEIPKTEVKDAGRHPFYAWAEEKLGTPAVPVWNFHKILVGPDGEAIAAFGPRTPPQDPTIVEAVEKAL